MINATLFIRGKFMLLTWRNGLDPKGQGRCVMMPLSRAWAESAPIPVGIRVNARRK